MKKATLVGYHGRKNLGDDIFREIVLHWLRNKLNVTACSITAKKDSIALSKDLNLSFIESPIESVSRSIWAPIFISSLRCNYLVFSAGSIFTIQPFFIIYSMLILLRAIRGKNLKIFAIGVSIGPFRNRYDKYWCLKALALFDKVILRDKRSETFIENAMVNYKKSYDLALSYNILLDKIDPYNCNDKFKLGISITERGFRSCKQSHSDDCEQYVSLIERVLLSSTNSTVKLFAVCSDPHDGDIKLCTHVANRLMGYADRISIEIYDNNVDEYLKSLSMCSAIIASRMHAGIMGILNKVPVYQVSYAEKISEFYMNCGVDETYLRTPNEVTTDDMYNFVMQAFEGALNEFVEKQYAIIYQKGEVIVNDLEVLSEF